MSDPGKNDKPNVAIETNGSNSEITIYIVLGITLIVIFVIIFVFIQFRNKPCKDPKAFKEGGQCYTCPSGMTRQTPLPINDPMACLGTCKTVFPGASEPTGSFQDGSSGICYHCPSEMTRTKSVPIADDKACSGACATIYSNAPKPTGSFQDLPSGDCYHCPSGMGRRIRLPRNPPIRIDDDSACIGDCDKIYPGKPGVVGSFEGSPNKCYNCPAGFVRTIGVFGIDSDKACRFGSGFGIGGRFSRATFNGPNRSKGILDGKNTSPGIRDGPQFAPGTLSM